MSRHASDGVLDRFQRQALSRDELIEVTGHLGRCRHCRERATAGRERDLVLALQRAVLRVRRRGA